MAPIFLILIFNIWHPASVLLIFCDAFEMVESNPY